MNWIAITLAVAAALSSPALAGQPIIIDGCGVVETFNHRTVDDAGEHYTTTVVCYGAAAVNPKVRPTDTGILFLGPTSSGAGPR